MSQNELGDEEIPSPPSGEVARVAAGAPATPLTKGLSWKFWVWQCVPMVCLIIGMPPGENANWWVHISAVDWIAQQPWFNTLLVFIVGIMLSQGVLLAYWMAWGGGKWTTRICKVMGLAAIATLIPAIWFRRHFSIFRDGTNPWAEALDPLFLSLYFLGYLAIAFLPALLSLGMFHQMGFRLREIQTPKPLQQQWEFSWKEILAVTSLGLLLLNSLYWNYPNVMDWLARFQIPQSNSIRFAAPFSTFMSTALAATLSALTLKLNDGRFTAIVFGSLLFLLAALGLWQNSSSVPNPEDYFLACVFHFGIALTLCVLTSLAIARTVIGHRRYVIEKDRNTN